MTNFLNGTCGFKSTNILKTFKKNSVTTLINFLVLSTEMCNVFEIKYFSQYYHIQDIVSFIFHRYNSKKIEGRWVYDGDF